jgi:hypothetical protein
MSDTNTVGASALMSGEAAPEPMSVSREKAYSRLGDMQRSATFQELLARNDPAALEELRSVRSTINTPTSLRIGEIADQTPEGRENMVNTWANFCDLPPEVLQQVREQRPVSAAEFRLAQAERRRLMQDSEFVRQYLSGSRAARSRMALISIILGSQIAAS